MDAVTLLISADIDKYSIAADIATFIICLMNWLLVTTTYTKKQINLKLFHMGNAMVLLASCTSMAFHILVSVYDENIAGLAPYALHTMMYIFLASVYVFYLLYIKNLILLESKYDWIYLVATFGPYALFIILKLIAPITGFGFYYSYEEVYDNVFQRYISEPFRFLYVYDNLFMIVVLWTYRRKFITKMLQCIVEAASMSWVIIIAQDLIKQTSYTCLTFILPIEAVLFLYHYSAYDIDTGTLDVQAFNSYIADLYTEKLTFVSLTLENLEKHGLDNKLSTQFYHFNEKYFNDSIIFKMNSNTLIMILKDSKNPDCQIKMEEMLQDFRGLYNKFLMEFKVVILHSDNRLNTGRLYAQLDDYLKKKMEFNSVYYCTDEDLASFFEDISLLNELKDISAIKNLSDDRVKVFCQPVLDTKSKSYNTAEALMRIELPNKGMIYPNTFIPMLENLELIHDFTLIMLNKTCTEIKRLMEEGYQLDRVSINVSMQELKNKNLCKEITDIIEKNKIPYEKIGIELTESMNDFDFENAQFAISQWKKYNMKIYLDDFGTGYSNISRIIQMPFDVIKFDRSLTIASGQTEQSHFIVDNFAKIFKRTKYHVLFEGIETIEDEERCIAMGADMLQGYAYSKPIPIEKLRNYLDKNPSY